MAVTRKRKKIEPIEEIETIDETETYHRAPRSQKNTPYLLIVLLMVVSFFAGYLFNKTMTLEKTLGQSTQQPSQQTAQQQQQAAPPAPTITIDKVKTLFTKDYLSFGDANRKVLFVEVSDPSCPFCHIAGGFNPELSKQVNPRFQYVSDGGTYRPPVTEMKKLVDEGKASFVMLYSNGHGNGILSAQALYCAYEQDKFWEVHDRLMSNEGYELINNTVQNDKKNIPALAEFLSGQIDSGFLTECLESEKYAAKLTRDEQLTPSLGFSGTPHFIINTTMVNGAQDYKEMESIVNTALEN